MILPSLAVASGFLKTLFFAAITRNNLYACITLATIDLSLYGAQLATYAGLSRSGLPLPVGLYLPPPRSMTSTDLVLYATPFAAATLHPTINAFGALLESSPQVLTLNSVVIHRTVNNIVRQHNYYARLIVRTQPVLSLISGQELLRDPYGSDDLSSHTPVTRLRLSATVGLGQCAPYRVLPTWGSTLLATDNSDEHVLEIDYATEILDRLEESEESMKEFVLYQAPLCTSDSCALVVYAGSPQAAFEAEMPACVVFALWCYGWIVPFAVVWVFPFICWSAQWLCYIVLAALGVSHRLLKNMFIAVIMHILNVCVRLYIDSLVEPNNVRNVEHAPVFDIPSPVSLAPPDHTPSFDAAPSLASYSTPEATVQVASHEPARKKRKQKKSKKTGAKVEDKSVKAVAPDMEQGPATPVGPSSCPVDAPFIDPASIPLPEDGDDEELLPSSVQAPSLPVAGPSQGPDQEIQDQDEGEWTTVVNRKPWRSFTPVLKTGADSKLRGGGRKGERGRGKGERKA
ncbi:hypothetical protein RhiJN_13795 [Ceratobasidium sp. AG-Ba]|nr:hypothetical protein RhiJN_13795 [Ceratobasidium sp. AG-Ba]QRW14354.1 hypothetical protein RhiLY_13353 [Ceratobasidium sp. AG-Ba]